MINFLPIVKRWTDRVAWLNWSGLELYLKDKSGWPTKTVNSIAEQSLQILSSMPDPNQAVAFQGRGLVIGYVQSGKTANYTALAARAADAGYRLVIVLSGIHDSLRNQTQKRLNDELIGTGSGWESLTTEQEDFAIPPNPGAFAGSRSVLVVAKKIVPILERLEEWFDQLEGQLGDIPVLLIDDEADQASINTRDSSPSISLTTIEEQGATGRSGGETAPSRTNELIRSILRMAPKASYVAYTATPFANLLIDPSVFDRAVGEDLFPRDFVHQLPRPDEYTGTEELFGTQSTGREVVRIVPTADIKLLKRARPRKHGPVAPRTDEMRMPASLASAVASFALIGAIRSLRGDGSKSHTMLVHVSASQADQRRVGDLITEMIDAWRALESLRPGSLLERLGNEWRETKSGVIMQPDLADSDITSLAADRINLLDVEILNSDSGAELNYSNRVGRSLIVVGGNRLSRGLTLEGLTVSYFLRTATTADTMLQMARWYGYRQGYADLIRIWTTSDIAAMFTELALVEDSLRRSVQSLQAAGRKPIEMAIKLRAHSQLLLTARNKSRSAADADISFSGEHPQTTMLPLWDDEAINYNWALADAFIKSLPIHERAHGALIAHDVPASSIVMLLSHYRGHEDALAFVPLELAAWISERNSHEELTYWSVCIGSPESAPSVALGGQSIGLTKRTATGSDGIGALIAPVHEGIDLPGGPSAYMRQSGAYDTALMRQNRPPHRGLLIIYVLDPNALDVEGHSGVIALALSLPNTSDEVRSYIINGGLSRA